MTTNQTEEVHRMGLLLIRINNIVIQSSDKTGIFRQYPVIDPVKNYPVKLSGNIRLPVPVASAPVCSGAGQNNLLRSVPNLDGW